MLLFALALLLAQGLGLLHQVAHGSHAPSPWLPGPVATPPVEASPHLHDGRHGHGGEPVSAAHAVFDGHDEGSVECRLYDQLAHADGLVGSALTGAPPAAPDRVSGPPPTRAPGSTARHFEARGPPTA